MKAGSYNLSLFVAARSASQLGDMMLPVGLAAGVLAAGYGATGVGLVLAAALLPFVALMLIGGVLADHLRPKPVLVVADVTRVLSMGLLVAEFAGDHPSLWRIVALQAVTGTAGALFEPGSKSVVPEIARGRVREAYALLRISESLVTMAGPALAGGLLAFTTPAVVIAIDATSYLASAVLILLTRLPLRPPHRERLSLRSDLTEGWREFRARPWLVSVVAVFCTVGIVVSGPHLVLGTTVLIEEHGATTFGLLQAVFGVGAVLGGIAGLRTAPRRPLFVGALASAAFMPQLVLIALGMPVAVLGLGMLVAGAGRAYWGVMWSHAIQVNVPAAVLSRVSAYEIMGTMLMVPAGRAAAGPVGAAFGETHVLVAAGVLGTACMAALLLIPSVRNLPGSAPEPDSDPPPVPLRKAEDAK
ncbi:MFS transporter [Streptomyces sp. LHD-70]|uniref:MFS transporter n=1 Tax=Streptomyces sp. LHD-70 TaxID=3072140 RepID=UPI00280C6882|nr:MFS transporter [Streptomyces sp. LHD-70]MDQ8706964.1 MFS transporter [Streptomyces sp. LHD-70]